MTPAHYLKQLNSEYLAVHQHKEALFWQVYMGISDDQQGLADAENGWNDFVSDPARIEGLKLQLESLAQSEQMVETAEVASALNGWLTMFNSHVPETDLARSLKQQLVDDEAAFFKKRKDYLLHYVNEEGERIEASLPVLSATLRTSSVEAVRKSAHQALLDLEVWLLENGFLEMVKQRNAYARAMGFSNYFDYSVTRKDQMPPQTLLDILGGFEEQTRDTNIACIADLKEEQGPQALLGHNFVAASGGNAVRDLEPYLPFSKALNRWITSFSRLNISFSGADLTLDLLERKGKYQNGFCHGPTPSFYDEGKWVPAQVGFTSNAKPNQLGCGYREINTFFHEGGHAAHFANVKQNAPCFSQEFAPTTMAYAETQSMFCDSLLGDVEWLKRYAYNLEGDLVPDEVIRAFIESSQPTKAFDERSILAVPFFEQALYALSDDELTPEAALKLARKTEKEILGLDVAPRPLLAIPHFLNFEYACAYHGYLLANMAVYQTRAHFVGKYGYLVDNPAIGPALAEHYWAPGNSMTHNDTLVSLTGEGFNPQYLADACNLSAKEAWEQQLVRLDARNKAKDEAGISLDAAIKVVDGDNLIASNEESDEAMCEALENYIQTTYFS